MDCINPWILSKSIDWSIIHGFKSLNCYCNFFFCYSQPFFLYFIPSYFIIFLYSFLFLVFFVLNILIVFYIFNITRSLILYYYLIDYLKYILDKNLYNQVFPSRKIILLFILFFPILIIPPVIYVFCSPSLKTFDTSNLNTILLGSTFMLSFLPEIRQVVLL
jgi:hypothetical protein